MSTPALVILKPDILSGPFAVCGRAAARDTVRGLLSVYTAEDAGPFEVAASAGAVAVATRAIDRKARAGTWYVRALRRPEVHLPALRELVDGPALAGPGVIETAELVRLVVRALGFRELVSERRLCTHRDYLGLYADNAHFTRLAGSLRAYLVGREIVVSHHEGDQELSAPHIVKEVVRRVVRYPATPYDAVENLLHVADPGSPDWLFFTAVVPAPQAVKPVSQTLRNAASPDLSPGPPG
ncbi:hypothetical protein [Actinokineospora iranica]|uniref:Nucleoside diphosphate kinase n=1 Tax=Actinokineospora iranica TaxID=1271860 RepID=A0A1G6U9W1_9PSEU|nr:hypothetical protein [Actinokineospora iranica]SDD37345.1 hypothetical protein SAMN05216174_110149 [Actinokineospora iranica]